MFHRILAVAGLTLALGLASAPAHAAGALAIDRNQGQQYGWAHDYPTLAQAERRALNECGSNCTIVLRFVEGCGAYAADQARGSTAYGWATGPSAGSVQNRALQECRSRGGSMCLVRSWGCNSR